jgi:peptide/nickel transport system permease protein
VKRAFFPVFWLCFLSALTLLRDVVANSRPLYCRIGQERFFPGLRTVWADPAQPYQHPVLDAIQQADAWHTFPYDAAVFAPIPFSPGEWTARPACNLQPPGTIHPEWKRPFRHWIGTDRMGRDVAAGIVSGARIAILTGTLAMLMAVGIGLVLGAVAGFFGDRRLGVSRSVFWALSIGALPVFFYVFQTPLPEVLGWWLALVVVGWLGACYLLGLWLKRWKPAQKIITIPADLLLMRLAEVFNATPKLPILVAVAALSRYQSVWFLIALIGALSWTSIARLVRSELLRIRNMDYVEAARGLGFSEGRVLLRHALPNAMRPVYVALALGMGSAIQLEAALSLLGFGGQDFQGVSWGSLLEGIRYNPTVWWVALPPALCIALTVLALNDWGEQQ